MTKVGEQCEKREKTIKRLNDLAIDVDIAGQRVTKAGEAYEALIVTHKEEEALLRKEMEASLQASLDALHKDANSAKCELGTARQVFRDVEQKYRLTLSKMRTLLGDAEAEHDEPEDDAEDEPKLTLDSAIMQGNGRKVVGNLIG